MTSADSDQDIVRLRDWTKELGGFGMELVRYTVPKAKEQLEEPPPKPLAINYLAEFARLCAVMRQLIALEFRIRTSKPAATSAFVRSPTANDPRQAPLRRTLFHAVRSDPDRARLQRAINERIDQELLADPAADIPVGNVLESICQALDIVIDPAHLPDEMLPFDEDDPSPTEINANPPEPSFGQPPNRFFRP